jgi:hypothetical protein
MCRPKGHSEDYKGPPWVIIDIGFSNNSRSCGVTINGKQIPDPVGPYRVTSCKPKTLGDKHYGMLCPAITQWLSQHQSSGPNRPVNLMIEAPLSMAFTKRSEPGGKLQGAHQGNPIARIPDRLEGSDTNDRTQVQQRLWYTQPASGLMIASIRLIQELAIALDGWNIRLFEGFVSFKKGDERTGHWRDTYKLWHALQVEDKAPKPLSSAIINPQKAIAQSVLELINLSSTSEVPPVLRVSGSADSPVIDRYAREKL